MREMASEATSHRANSNQINSYDERSLNLGGTSQYRLSYKAGSCRIAANKILFIYLRSTDKRKTVDG